METRIASLAKTPAATAAPGSAVISGQPGRRSGKYEAQMAKLVGLTQFGVNQVTLEPGVLSARRHWHEQEDEFVYVLSGELVLIDDNGEYPLVEGSIIGFPAGCPNAHHLANRSSAPASYIVVGTRKPGRETVHYPDEQPALAEVFRDERGERIDAPSTI